MKKGVSIVFLLLIFVGTLIFTNRTTAIHPNLTAECKIHSPWWTPKTEAWAKVTWGHWSGIQPEEPHWHTFRYSLYARVADGNPDQKSALVYHHSTTRSSRWKIASAWGEPRWDGDAYSSGSITDESPKYLSYRAFCAAPKP